MLLNFWHKMASNGFTRGVSCSIFWVQSHQEEQVSETGWHDIYIYHDIHTYVCMYLYTYYIHFGFHERFHLKSPTSAEAIQKFFGGWSRYTTWKGSMVVKLPWVLVYHVPSLLATFWGVASSTFTMMYTESEMEMHYISGPHSPSSYIPAIGICHVRCQSHTPCLPPFRTSWRLVSVFSGRPCWLIVRPLRLGNCVLEAQCLVTQGLFLILESSVWDRGTKIHSNIPMNITPGLKKT